MATSELKSLVETVVSAYMEFETALHASGPFPQSLFDKFYKAVEHYAEATSDDEYIHKDVASIVNSIRELLELKALGAPGKAIASAARLETILFSGYDPHFDGHEPPGL